MKIIVRGATGAIGGGFAATVFAYTTDQAPNGKDVYAKNCAICHGASGGGGTVPKHSAILHKF